MFAAARFRYYPGTKLKRRVMADVLIVPAIQLGDPVILVILMESLGPSDHWLCSGQGAPVLGVEKAFSWVDLVNGAAQAQQVLPS
jgi:hypothetical protein